MAQLEFAVQEVVAEQHAVTPTLLARLRISSTGPVHALALRCQLRIDVRRRRYDDAEADALLDLFGPRSRWSDTLTPFSWLHATAMVPGFTGGTVTDLVLPCSYDFEVTGARYLHALRSGDVPIEFLFSGTVFAAGETGSGLAVTPVPWDRQARYDLPVRVWRELMDRYYPDAGWLRLDRDTLDALGRYKSAHGLTGWDDTVRRLLAGAGQVSHG